MELRKYDKQKDGLTGVGAKDTCVSKNLFIDTSYSCYLSDKSTFEIVLPPFLPRDHQPMEYIIEGEIDDVVQPEDDRGGQDRGVDNEDGEEEENEAEERPGHEVAWVLLEGDQVPPVLAQRGHLLVRTDPSYILAHLALLS